MNMKQFRKPANMHSRTAIAGGRIISLDRLERMLAQAKQKGL